MPVWELRWPRDSRCDSSESIRANCFAEKPIFMITRKRFAKKGFGPGTLAKTIRDNQAMHANLRIDSRESGHLSLGA